MKITKTYILFLSIFGLTSTLTAQVKIGDDINSIDETSILELESTSKVMVLTRMTNDQMMALNPLAGGLVYNIDTGCIHSYNGTSWISLCEETNTEQNQEQTVITASTGQTQFTTPIPIIDDNKVEVFRNGVKIAFTTLNANTIQLESGATCYQNDTIRIVQIF
ncbi:hypothetical protein [Maribacter forsetii]|uniref:hypothetical protein n=1 Tax=Maribacter forsetii TaxID=444515 RepID=UPI00055D90F0|nr:hypothetical protein [Maribacter forsetii]